MRTRLQVETEKQKSNDWIWLVIIGIIVLGGWYWLEHRNTSSRPAETAAQDLSVRVAPLTPQDVSVAKTYIGYVTPINEVKVLPYISGFLDQIKVRGGQEVSSGENLVMIRQGEYKAQLDASKAAVLQAQADFNNAKVYYDRVKQAGPKAISKTEFDNAKAKFLGAQAAVAQAKANQALAQVNYDYTYINAPISGIVGDVSLTKGDYVSPGATPLFSIIQYDPIRVVFSITDKDYLQETAKSQLFEGEKINLKLADGQTYERAGEYKYADNQVDRSTNSISVYADFANPDRKLVANAYVDVVVEKNYRQVVPVRKNLVQLDPAGDYVYVVNNNQLGKAKVTIIDSKGNDYILAAEFKPGDYLVLDKVNPQMVGGAVKPQLTKTAAVKQEKA